MMAMLRIPVLLLFMNFRVESREEASNGKFSMRRIWFFRNNRGDATGSMIGPCGRLRCRLT